MNLIEEKGLLAGNQFGFRKGFNCADAVMVASTLIDKARHLGLDTMRLAFIDVRAAYDTTSREALFNAMNSHGLGGRIVKLLRSFYVKDNVRIEIGGKRSQPLYLKNGLKQGCSTSPVSFNLVMCDIAEKMNNANSILRCDGMGMSCLFYADDILLICPTETCILKAIKELEGICGTVGLKVSLEKSKIVTTVIKDCDKIRGKDTLEMVLHQNYLGVTLQIGLQSIFLESRVEKAIKLASNCMSIAKSSPSPFLFATVIWGQVALPSILHGTEVIILTDGEIREIEKQQNRLAKFILQVHRNSAGVVTQLLAGMMPFYAVYMTKVLKYYVKMNKYQDSHWTKKALKECERLDKDSEYIKKVGKMAEILNWDGEEDTLEDTIASYTVRKINEDREEHRSSCNLLPRSTRENIVCKSPMDNCDPLSKVYHEFITYNAGLGNRHPIPDYVRTKKCVLCVNDGRDKKLNEKHLLFSCEAMTMPRVNSGVEEFKQRKENSGKDIHSLYRSYWCEAETSALLNKRIKAAKKMKDIYIEAATTIMDQMGVTA